MAESSGDELTIASWNPNPKLIRRNALLDMFAIVPWVMAGVVHSSKEIELDSVLDPIVNTSSLTMDTIANTAQQITSVIMQNATSTPAGIDPKVIASDVFQVVFASIGLVGVFAHRLKHEASRLGFFNQMLIASSAFFYLIFDTAINHIPNHSPMLIAKDVLIACGGTGLALEIARLSFETIKGHPAMPRASVMTLGNPIRDNRLNRGFEAGVAFFGSAAVAMHTVKEVALEAISQPLQQPAVTQALGFTQIATAPIAALFYIFRQFTTKSNSSSQTLDRSINGVLTFALGGWATADGLVNMIPASEKAQTLKTVFTGFIAMLTILKFVKLLVEAINDKEITPGGDPGYNRL